MTGTGTAASVLHSDVERAVRAALKHYVFDQPAINGVVRALDPDTVELIHGWLPRGVGFMASFLPNSLFGSTSMAHLVRDAVQEAGKESANMIKEGQEVSAEKVGEILAAKLKEVGDRMVDVDEFGHIHLGCDNIARTPDNRKRKIKLVEAVEQKRIISPCCTETFTTVTMPPTPKSTRDFRGFSVIEKLQKIEALAELDWISALDKTQRDRIVALIQDTSSEEELKGALARLKSGDDLDKVIDFIADCNPAAKARRNLAIVMDKVTDAVKTGVAQVKAFDASLAPKVKDLQERVTLNREAKTGFWGWVSRNGADLKAGAVIIGLMVLALVFFL